MEQKAASIRRPRCLRTDESGTTGAIIAVLFSGILMASAVALDFGQILAEYTREQYALDAAALAATDKIGMPDQETAVAQTAQAFWEANRTRGNAELTAVKINPGDGTISGTTGGIVKHSLMQLFGLDYSKVSTRTKISKGTGSIELALVLDNSEALAGQPLDDLKAAARLLVNKLFQAASISEDLRIGIVPFAGAVNVGTQYRGQSWIDNDGLSAFHFENVAERVNRFTLFERMGTSWAGCVEVRQAPYDVTEAAPIPGNPQTLFVPLFAPDEPDEINADGATYTNSYLPDAGGTCPAQTSTCLSYNRKGDCTRWSTPPLPSSTAQRRTCKYANSSIDTSRSGPTRKGPNMHCEARPLTRLTNRKADLLAEIDAMTAAGAANIGEGVMWGWRVISPLGPFADGQPYANSGSRKIMIVLARGANWAEGLRNINDSSYSAWGFGVNNRLNPNSHTTPALTNSMNEMTRAACRNTTAKGVDVYTVGFGQSDAHTRSMLQYCATHPHMNFDAQNLDQLLAVFDGIAKSLLKLRVAG